MLCLYPSQSLYSGLISSSDLLGEHNGQTHKPNFQAKLNEVVGPACGISGLSIIRTKVSGPASLGPLPRERCLALECLIYS